jgi:hypothetical protein
MTKLDHEATIRSLLRVRENELRQLRWENQWLLKANKGLIDELEKVRKLLPTGATI